MPVSTTSVAIRQLSRPLGSQVLLLDQVADLEVTLGDLGRVEADGDLEELEVQGDDCGTVASVQEDCAWNGREGKVRFMNVGSKTSSTPSINPPTTQDFLVPV